MIKNLEVLVQFALDEAKKQGATAAEVSVSHGLGFQVDVHRGDVEKLEHQNDHGFEITLYRGQQKGSASTTFLNHATIQSVVSSANDIAKLTASDPYAGLADAGLMAKNAVDLDLYYLWSITTEEAVQLAVECEATGLNYDSSITGSDGVSVSTHTSKAIYANSQGFLGEYSATRHDVSCVLIAERDGEMERDYCYDQTRDPRDLMSVTAVAKIAAQRTVERLSSRRLSTRQVPVVFCNELARGFFRQFIAAISGGSLYRRSSFLLDAKGEALFPDFVNIYERPFIQKAMGSAWFDSDGLATREQDFVKDGVLTQYCLGVYSARRLGLTSTGNADGVHNLIVEPTAGDLKGLFKTMQTGLYVTDMLGHGANIVTGDYSVGVAGFWVENGEIQYPVSEITVAANLKDLYRGVVAIGSDIDYRGNVRTGSVLFESMTVAGN